MALISMLHALFQAFHIKLSFKLRRTAGML
jgi:hypothetical protein